MFPKTIFFFWSVFHCVYCYDHLDLDYTAYDDEPSNLPCGAYRESMPNPTDCSKYYYCGPCPGNHPFIHPRVCHFSVSCPEGQLYHPSLKMCYATNVCPTVRFELSEIPCRFVGEKFPHPDGCHKYLVCSRDHKEWHALERTCVTGQCYDVELERCTTSRFRGQYCLPEVSDHKCLYNGDYFPHPSDCKKYYACEKVGYCGRRVDYWGYLTIDCPEGKFYNAKKQKCEVAPQCPQGLRNATVASNVTAVNSTTANTTHSSNDTASTSPTTTTETPITTTTAGGNSTTTGAGNSTASNSTSANSTSSKLPEGFECAKIGDTNVLPDDCKYFYKCRKNKKGETYVTKHRCPLKQKFYQKERKCVTTWTCPQDPDWAGIPKCDFSWDHRVKDSEDCTRFWWFMDGCKGPVHGQCDEGFYFSWKTETCVLGECPYPMSRGRTVARRKFFYSYKK